MSILAPLQWGIPVLFVCGVVLFLNGVDCYNLSPKANVIIKDPQLATGMPKWESSYFGYTLNLRPLGIIIGAPRAQSTLPSQRHINETGAIYKCSLKDGLCNPYIFDDRGNVLIENSEYTFDSEKRDFQWLGGSMDGGTSDTDKLLVCAPRFIAPTPNNYLMHGICYWINDTLSSFPNNVRKISPLRLKTEQTKNETGKVFYLYQLAEQGLSAHVSANNEEFIIGAPGIHNWKGSVIRYRKKLLTDDPSLSRRDTRGSRIPRQSDAQPQAYYSNEVPNPEKWDQPNDSYFGYAVGTGYFDSNDLKRLLYVATAPQANEQSGEAYLFGLSGDSINKYFVFRGKQFGEYFGYSILAEDLNGDGLTDVIISAPQYTISGSFDDGAIYVFVNQGKFNFERILMTSPVHGKARFGTTLTKLGDINHDGYNDIAVGAPFAGNGSVFIYLGNAKGLREQSSQRIDSPITITSKYGGTHMFGHGLSKGSDIDANGFNDFAVGAPNAESVLLYRAYPVVKVLVNIHSETREIKTDQRKFQIKACWAISTTSTKINTQDLALHIVADPQVKRVRLAQSQSNEMSFNVSAGRQNRCQVIDCEIVDFRVSDIFKPIELEIHYHVINGVPNSEVFCDQCVAVDPAEPKVYTEKIIFNTGCASSICVADLQVRSVDLDNNYILGSTRTLAVTYDVSNTGETAYLPQINITSSNRMPFARIPSNCKVNNNENAFLICDLNRGQPMAKGTKDTITAIFDVSGISGKAIIITAVAFSTGKELTPGNNVAKDVITLKEFTTVEAVGMPKTPHLNLEKTLNTTQIINNYEIKSVGPSTVGALELAFNIPVAYRVAGSKATIPIIDSNTITMQAVYDAQRMKIDFYQNNTQIIMNTYEFSTSSATSSKVSKVISDAQHHYDSVKIGHVNEMHHPDEMNNVEHSLSDSVLTASMSRRRRDAAAHTATKEEYAKIAKAHDLLGDDLKGKLPVNRTIVFNCNDPEMTICVRAVMRVYNFKPEYPITVTLKYNIDLEEVNQILIEPWEFFVVFIGLDVTKVAGTDTSSSTLAVRKNIEYNIISKHQLYGTPIWVWILAIIGGLLLLALMSYGMYRAGFFKRAKREEMDALVQQNPAGSVEPEEENLNSDNNQN